uniref:Uncharacterized protein n=1 Tax=Moniliophthora roreri TaxID=221103 RepID=A0A0W0F4P6_MONRR
MWLCINICLGQNLNLNHQIPQTHRGIDKRQKSQKGGDNAKMFAKYTPQ